jgi:hypothetical protein
MPKRKMTAEVFQSVCDEIQVSHKGLHTLCKEKGSSAPAFFDLMEGDETLTDLYTCARARQADYLADLIHEVAFDGTRDDTPFTGANHVQRDKLKVESLKWTAAKLKPKKYGDKIDVTSDGEKLPTQPIVINLGSGIDPNATTD